MGESLVRLAAMLIPILAFPSIALASDAPVLEARRVAEAMRDGALISGNWMVGVHGTADMVPDRPSLMADLPGAWNGEKVCARTISRDGLYYSFFEYDVPASWGGGLAVLQYPTEFVRLTEGATTETSGVVVHRGGCDVDSVDFALAYWNADPQSPSAARTILFNLNAGRSDRVEAWLTSPDRTPIAAVSCEPLAGGGVSFNHRCEADLPAGASGDATLTVLRYRSGRRARPRTATIHLGR